ncbi:MAG: hypothetical protein Q7O66_21840 [Dehalococcoidia bacterium]|nr:hypothetical protein [Dehalococcoidia bacterium]
MKELETIDISNEPELLRLVDEIRSAREPRLLRRNHEDLAILTPINPRKRALFRAAPVTRDDALFDLIGIGESQIPGGVSGKKHEYLAKAYRPR